MADVSETTKERDLLNYLLSERTNRLTPTIRDLCYTAFMRAKGKNDEDGGPTDWFNDTLPIIEANLQKIRDELNAQP